MHSSGAAWEVNNVFTGRLHIENETSVDFLQLRTCFCVHNTQCPSVVVHATTSLPHNASPYTYSQSLTQCTVGIREQEGGRRHVGGRLSATMQSVMCTRNRPHT